MPTSKCKRKHFLCNAHSTISFLVLFWKIKRGSEFVEPTTNIALLQTLQTVYFFRGNVFFYSKEIQTSAFKFHSWMPYPLNFA